MAKNKDNIEKQLIEDFNLPKYVKNKTFADASKAINNKFKDRKDQYANQTKEELLERLANAQEFVKMQEQAAMEQEMGDMSQGMMEGGEEGMQGMQDPQQMPMQEGPMPDLGQSLGQPGQMAYGGYRKPMYDGGEYEREQLTVANQGLQSRGPETMNQGLQQQQGVGVSDIAGGMSGMAGGYGGAISGAASLYNLGASNLGPTGIDSSGMQGHQKLNSIGADTGKAALAGAAAGASIGSVVPVIGTAIGGAVGAVGGGVMGYIGGKKKQDKLREGNTNMIYRQNAQYDGDRVAAMGGYIDPRKDRNTKEMAIRMRENQNAAMNSIDGRPALNLGTYKDSGYFDIKDQGVNYVVSPTSNNPQNAQGYNDQMKYLRSLNPNAQFSNNGYTQFQGRKKMSGGGYGYDPYGDPTQFQSLIGEDPNALFNPRNHAKSFLTSGPGMTTYGVQGPGSQMPNQQTPRFDFMNDGVTYGKMDSENMSNTSFNPRPIDWNKVGKFAGDNIRQAASLAPALGSAFNKIKKPVTDRGPRLDSRYKKSRMDEAAMANQINQNNIQGAVSGSSGGDLGSAMSNIQMGNLNKMKALGQSYLQKSQFDAAESEKEQNFNSIVDRTNLQQEERYIERKAQDEGAYNTAKADRQSAITDNIGDVSKEMINRQTTERMFGYNWRAEYKRNNPNATEEDVQAAYDKKFGKDNKKSDK